MKIETKQDGSAVITIGPGKSVDRISMGLAFVESVAGHCGYTPAHFMGPSRMEPICTYRHAAMHIMRERMMFSSVEIGEIFGRVYTTVNHAVRSIRIRMENEPRTSVICKEFVRLAEQS